MAADGERRESLLVCEDPGAGPLRVLVSDVAFRVCRQLAAGTKNVRFMAFCDHEDEGIRLDAERLHQELSGWIGTIARSLEEQGGGWIELRTLPGAPQVGAAD